MNRRRMIAALLTLTALTLGSVPMAGPASAADKSGTGVVDCLGKIVQKPAEIVITCADAGVMVSTISWTSWNNNRATGRGTLVWNTCLPETCVAGIVQKYKVRVVLGRPASGPNAAVFTRLTLAFPQGGPANLETGTYTLDRPIAGNQ